MCESKDSQQVALPTLSRLLHIRIPGLPLKERRGIVMRSNMTQQDINIRTGMLTQDNPMWLVAQCQEPCPPHAPLQNVLLMW